MAHPPMPETAFKLETLEDIAELRRGLRRIAGSDLRKVPGCVDWAVAMATGQPATESPQQLSAYRKLLRAVLAERGEPWPPPRARRRNGQALDEPARTTAERGAAKVRGLVAVACVGAATVLAGGAGGASAARISPSPAFEAQPPIIQVSRRPRASEGRRAA